MASRGSVAGPSRLGVARGGLNRQFKVPALKAPADIIPVILQPTTMPDDPIVEGRAMSPIEISSSDDGGQDPNEKQPKVVETLRSKVLTSEKRAAQPQGTSKNISASSVGNPLGTKNRDVLYPAGPVKVRMQGDPASDDEVDDLEVVVAKNRTLAQGNRRTGTLESSYSLR
jgi:hypothetical protein